MFNIEMTSPNLGHQHLLYFLFRFRSLCTWVSSHAIYWTWNQWCVTPWPSSRQKLIHCFLEDSCLGSDLPVWFPWHITFLDIQWCNLPKTRSPTIWLEAHGPLALTTRTSHQSLLLVLGLKLQPWAGKAEPTTCNVFGSKKYVELNYGQFPIDLVKLIMVMLLPSASQSCKLNAKNNGFLTSVCSCDCISHSGNWIHAFGSDSLGFH